LNFADGHLCKHVLDSLKRWEFEVNPTSEDDISPQGRMDMQLLAKRTKDKMSEVLVKEINRNTFKVNNILSYYKKIIIYLNHCNKYCIGTKHIKYIFYLLYNCFHTLDLCQ